nr:uncharacterized protein LOC121120434 isoform X2 [Lepeophtheirus salmonis]
MNQKYLLDQEEYPSRNVQPCANCKGITFLSLRPPLYPESGNKKEIRVQKTEEKIIATSYRRRSATPELTKAISSFKIIENMIKSSSSNVSTKSKPLFLP